MIVADASVLIAHLDGADMYHERAHTLLLRSAGDALAASPLTLAEVLVGPARAGRLDSALAALHQLGVSSVELDENAPVRLALLRAHTNLKLPDCCVLLAAEQSHATVATFDGRQAAAARERGLKVLE